MSAKKTILKAKTLSKKMLKELKKNDPDFSAIGSYILKQVALLKGLQDKLMNEALVEEKAEELQMKKKKAKKKVAKAKSK